MTTDKQTAKKYLKIYLEHKGLDTKKHFHCLNPEHPDKNPSMRYDARRCKVHCFSCGADYDIFDVVAIDYNLKEHGAIFKKTYELLNISPFFSTGYKEKATVDKKLSTSFHDIPSYLAQMTENISQTDYHQKRGLSEKTCRLFGVGYDPSFKASTNSSPWKALIIPTGVDSFTARNTDFKAPKSRRIRKIGAAPVFNASALWKESSLPLLLVEGEIDALCVYEAGGEAVALGSCANVSSFLKIITKRPPLRPLLIALDNDDEGHRASERLVEGLKCLCVDFYVANPYKDAKDAAEALVADPGGFRDAIFSFTGLKKHTLEIKSDDHLSNCAANYLSYFRENLNGQKKSLVLSTGFQYLDRALDGGLYEGLYIVGGISSLGKSTFINQMGDQIAQAGRDVLIFSLEMARHELMAKSLSRLSLLKALEKKLPPSLAKSARGISCAGRYAEYSSQEKSLIESALNSFALYADRIFIRQGEEETGTPQIRQELEKHCRLSGCPPVLFVDYLQILSPSSYRAGDKQNIDKNVLELKRLSRDFQIPVIVLSSFNRSSYNEAVSMEAFKESGAIEYCSDVLLGLQLHGAGTRDFDPLAAKEKNPRLVELLVLKNRQGPAGHKVNFEYYPAFNYFKDIN